VQRLSREEAKGKRTFFSPLYYRLTFHSVVEIGQAALSVELPSKHAPGQSKGNGKRVSSSMPKLQLCQHLLYRGPAKGYIEGLEHRLRETESLLLQLLPAVTEDYLEAVITDHEGSPARSTTTLRRPILNNKTGVEYWEQYPLDSPESIRRWQQDCSEGRSYRSSARSSQERLPSANLDMDPIEPVERPLSRYQQSMPSSAEVVMSPENVSTSNEQSWLGTNATLSHSMLICQTAPNNFGMASWNQVKDIDMRAQFQQRDSSEAYPGQFELDRAKGLREGPFYLSDFQRQFFW
jgi:hypothetical protein